MFSWQHITYDPIELGQPDLGFGLRSEFMRRSVHAVLQGSAAEVTSCAVLVNTQF